MDCTKRFLIIGFIIINALFFVSCGNDSGDTNAGGDNQPTGDIALNLVWQSGNQIEPNVLRSASELAFNDDGTIDCEQSQIAIVYTGIYDQFTGVLLIDNGTGWACSDHSGVVKNVPAGSGRKLVCLARDAEGNVIYRGEKSDIAVTAGISAQDADAIRIEMSPFTSDPFGLEDGAQINSDSPELQCGQVENAAAYRFQVATDLDFETVVLDNKSETNIFTPPAFTNSTTYYWRVRPVDMHGSEGAWSTPRMFNLSLPPVASTRTATSVTQTSAVLNGVVNPRGFQATYYFEYGTTNDYGSTTDSAYVGAGAADAAVDDFLQGLDTETTYHFRLVAINSAGTTLGPDRQFSTGDATGQVVVETQPTASAEHVSLDTDIFVLFNEPINEARLKSDSFTVSDGSGRIDGDFTCNGMTATFQLAEPLKVDTTYHVTLTTDFEDPAGNPLSSDFTWSFTTTEFEPPRVTAVYPYESARSVQVLPTITATFSEPMARDTLNSATFLVNDGADNIGGLVLYDEDTMTALFMPDDNLLCDTTYTVTITTGVEDAAGNALAAEKVWQFKTGDNCGGHVLAGSGNSLVIKADGTLWAWGSNNYGLLGDGTTDVRTTPTQIGNDSDWAQVSTESNHTLALKTDGSLWAWGRNGREGRLGDGTNYERHAPVRIGTDADWALVSAGSVHSLALKTDGTLWAWGENYSGQYGDGTTGWSNTPKQIGSDTDWMVVDTGNAHTVAVKTDGTLWAWGGNGSGRLGDGTTEWRTTPVPIGTDNDWATVYAGMDRTLALKTDGTLWRWGNSAVGSIGDETTGAVLSPAKIGSDTDWVAIGEGGSCLLKADGTLWTWKGSTSDPFEDGTVNGDLSLVKIGTDADWAEVSHSIAMKKNGTLWGWGINTAYQFGDGTSENKTVPTPLVIDTRWKAVSAGGDHTIALKSDGTLWAWGISGPSRLGDGTTDFKKVPVPIGTDRDWANVFASEYIYRSFVLKMDGTLWAWRGEQHIPPAQIGNDADWAQVASGSYHTLALKRDGTLWAWGDNSYGQLGDGTTDDRDSPVPIGANAKWVAIAAGRYHSLGLKADHTLWAWGLDDYFQLGDEASGNVGDTERYTTSPVKIGTDTDWESVGAGYVHSVALKMDGTRWAWGGNGYDQFGRGTTGLTKKPIQIGTDADWVSISAALFNTVASKMDGTLWSWGFDAKDGQLECQENDSQYENKQIVSTISWLNMSSGWVHLVALKTDGTLWAWGMSNTDLRGDGAISDGNKLVQINQFTIY